VQYVLQHSGARVAVVDAALARVARRVQTGVRWLATAGAAEGWASLDAMR